MEKENKNGYDKENEKFNEFIKENKVKIDKITPKNPTITKNDEWAREDWD